MSSNLLLLDNRPAKPQPIIRLPLPPLPPGQFDRTLPWTPPQTLDFMRANAWAVTIDGLPFVKGGSSRHPERCLSWFLDRWTPPWQDFILKSHLQRGYTHFVLSAPDSMIGNGLSLQAFVELCLKVKEAGLAVGVFLLSKDYNPRDQAAADNIAAVDPIIDALLAANAVDELYPAWEIDLFNVPGEPTINYCKHVGQRATGAGKTCWLHFSTEHTSWFADGDTRGRYGFWDDVGPEVTGILYQGDVRWDIGMYQARVVDTLTQFGRQGAVHKLRAFEVLAAAQFDGDFPNEDYGDLFGYLLCCTRGLVPVYGYGNGGRMPDGTRL